MKVFFFRHMSRNELRKTRAYLRLIEKIRRSEVTLINVLRHYGVTGLKLFIDTRPIHLDLLLVKRGTFYSQKILKHYEYNY